MATIHLINPMWSATGGSEWRTYELYRMLSPFADVKVWSPATPAPFWCERIPVETIDPWRWRFPRGGAIVFVGVYFDFGGWIAWTRAHRVIIVYNTDNRVMFLARRRRLGWLGVRRVEIVYASGWLRDSLGMGGEVQASPIDLSRFAPAPRINTQRPFTVGRLSRDEGNKHHLEDLELYNQLAAQGVEVKFMGGTCLAQRGVAASGVHLMAAGAEDAATFLHGLDCLFFRTRHDLREASGRVVQEAMACGLPVVCGSIGGFTEFIKNGENGFIVDTTDEAYRVLIMLKHDAELRQRIALQARASVEACFSPAALQQVRDFYLL